jgi:hypothetical protein
MIGALTIARAASDPALARTVLDGAKHAILAEAAASANHTAASKPAASNES